MGSRWTPPAERVIRLRSYQRVNVARRAVSFASIALAITTLPAGAQERGRSIAWIARNDLADAAVAVADPLHPVVYFNPAILEDLGPALTGFIRAHETAHILLHHSPTTFAHLPYAEREEAHRAAELAADCHAARILATEDPGAVRAAIAYFAERGSRRTGPLHPTGRDRAATLSSCARAVAVDPAGVSLLPGGPLR